MFHLEFPSKKGLSKSLWEEGFQWSRDIRQWHKGLKGNKGKEGLYLVGMGRQSSKEDRGRINNSKGKLNKSYGKLITVDAF